MLHFIEGRAAELVASEPVPTEGVVWVDLVRSDSDWKRQLPPGTVLPLHSRHESDILNNNHPPFFNKTKEYDFLILRAYDASSPVEQPRTKPIAVVMSGNVLVTIREPDDAGFNGLRQRWLAGELQVPTTLPSLLHRLLDEIVDELMRQRDPINELLTAWQDRLLDPKDPFNDWHRLMRMRNQLRWLSGMVETQLNVLDNWREELGEPLSQNMEIRFNDLEGHLRRVVAHAEQNQSAIDALVQIHFAANGQNINQTMQFLAVISCIFLPLNLVVGYFGMNFERMPFLRIPWAATAVFVGMSLMGLLMFWAFRRRRWI